jgi:hypothetical protein
MNKTLASALGALALFASSGLTSAHAGGVSFGIVIGVPAPVYHPAPVYYEPAYYPPPPVYYAPRVVYVPPVYYAPRIVYTGHGHRHAHGHHRHWR